MRRSACGMSFYNVVIGMGFKLIIHTEKSARVCLPCVRGQVLIEPHSGSIDGGAVGNYKFLIKLGLWRFLCHIKHKSY